MDAAGKHEHAWFGHAAAAVGGKLYVFGGIGVGGKLSTAEIYFKVRPCFGQLGARAELDLGPSSCGGDCYLSLAPTRHTVDTHARLSRVSLKPVGLDRRRQAATKWVV